MSLIPDFVIQSVLARGIKTMRNDSRFIDQLFRNLNQRDVDQMRTFIKSNAIDLCLNYPRTTLKVPAIVILLKSEKESQAYLGDSMGMECPDEFSFDGGIEGEILGGAASVSSLSGNYHTVFGPFAGLTGTENTLRIASSEWVTDQYVGKNLVLRILSGTGAGQIRKIVGNSDTVIMVDQSWLRVPDNTSVFEVSAPPTELIGEPSSLYDRRNPPASLERRGALYDMSYQIQAIGPNPELTIYLSVIIKSILTISRRFLEGQGVMNMKLSATDFLPRTEYQPDFAYMRAVNMEFVAPFDIFEALGNIADSFVLTLEVETPIVVANSA